MKTYKAIFGLVIFVFSKCLLANDICYEGIVGEGNIQNIMTICLMNKSEVHIAMHYPNEPDGEPANCKETGIYRGDAYNGNLVIQGNSGPCDNGRVMYGFDFVCNSTGEGTISCTTSVSKKTFHFTKKPLGT